MRQIFTNAGVAQLTETLQMGELSLYVDDASQFPYPIVGEEFFTLTLVGACEDRVEIVRVLENTDSYLRLDLRGMEGTEEQVFLPNDYAYHSLTAGMLQIIIDSWQWYLGPFDEPPLTDNRGDPLQEGHLYYQKPDHDAVPPVPGIMMVWDGNQWRPFSPTVAGYNTASYLWVIPTDVPGDTALPWPDSYGAMPIDFIVGDHALDIHLNGSKLVEQRADVSLVEGDYTVDYDNDTITILHPLQPQDVVEADVTLSVASDLADFIHRSEVDASGFGFVVTAGETTSVPDQVLPTLSAVAVLVSDITTPIINGLLTWGGAWVPGEYNPNIMVTDWPWLMVSTAVTSQRPAPQPVGDPEWHMPDVPGFEATTATVSVASGTKYIFNTGGWVAQARVLVPSNTDLLFKVQLLGGATGTELIYETSNTSLPNNQWALISIPTVIVAAGDVLRIHLEATHVSDPMAGPISYGKLASFWTANNPTWAAADGSLLIGGEDKNDTETGFGAELQFQPADVPTDWDVLAHSGAGGAGSGGAGGPSHIVSNSPPTASDGNEGDIWFVPVEP